MNNIFAYRGSVNFYMFHGGTNFGFLNGANVLDNNGLEIAPYYAPTITSYGERNKRQFTQMVVCKRSLTNPELICS